MDQTMQDIADRLNTALREKYGVTTEFFAVDTSGYQDRLVLLDASDLGTMHHFALVMEGLCAEHAEHDALPGQLRMF